MTIKEQFQKLKENWLIILLLAVVLVLFMGLPAVETLQQGVFRPSFGAYEGAVEESKIGIGMPSPIYDRGFAPEEKERKITKTAWLSTEVKRGTFREAENQLKSIVTAAEALLLNENVQKYGADRRAYYSGSYTVKVEEGKYDAVLMQLRQIGEVTSFNENKEDITKQFVSLEAELEAEKERLKRYQQMFAEATLVADKIEVSDRIFNQERTIKFLEEQLKNVGTRVEYATMYVTLTEKQSEYVDAVLVKFSELVTKFVASVNSLLKMLVGLFPYAVAVLIAWIGWKKYKNTDNSVKKK